MPEEFDASRLAEELAERLAQPEQTGPKYIEVFTGLNRATRRKLAKMQRSRERGFETWKRQLNAVGINWEDVLVERKRKAEERKKAA